MKILITGGAGYIGSILVSDLLAKDFKVTVVDDFRYKQNSLNHLCYNNKLKLIKADVRDINLLKNEIITHDVIIPLASLVGAPICNFNKVGAETINKQAVIELFNNISKDQIILMPTTNSAYGIGDKNNYCDENSPLNPISKYAEDKVEIEKKLQNLNNFISLRLATVFGMSPRMRLDLLVNDFVYRALKDRFIVLFESHFKRNYIHVRDVSRAFIYCLENYDKMKNQIFNLGLSDANLTKKELCIKIKNHINDFVFYENDFNKDPDQRNYLVSNKKIESFGYNTKYSIDFGIDELIKGFKVLNNLKNTNLT